MPAHPQRLVLAGWFSVLVPGDWTWNEEGGVTCIFQPQTGVGSMNISLFFRPRDAPASHAELADQALKFGRNLGARVKAEDIKSIQMNNAPAAYLECRDDAGDHWRTWHVARDKRLVLLSYNCPTGDCSREQKIIDKIIKSFAWEDTGSAPATETMHGLNGN